MVGVLAGVVGFSLLSVAGATPAFAADIPSAPTNVTAVAGNASATISFTAPQSDGGSAITSYTATATDVTYPAAGSTTASGSSSPITISGLNNGDAYTVTVQATNDVGTSDASAPSNDVTPYAVAPGTIASWKGRPTGASELRGISCPTTATCVAVGTDGDLFIEQELPPDGGQPVWSGSEYAGSGTLNGVSCASPGNCTAVGQLTNAPSGSPSAVALTETNGTWSGAVAVTGGTNGFFNAVSCTAPGFCTAVGIDSSRVPMFSTETNGNWSNVKAITSSSYSAQGGTFTGVSCTSPRNCVGVGQNANSDGQVIWSTETNGVWAPVANFPTNAGGGGLNGISCVSAGNCTAVGFDYSNSSPVYITETNGTWQDTTQEVSISGDTSGGTFNGVSCSDATDCVAVGATYGGQPIYALDTSGTWSDASPLNPAISGQLVGTSCVGGSCVATGTESSVDSGNFGIVETSITTPDAPTQVTATPNSALATVSWAPSSDQNIPIASYTVTATDGTTPANGGQTCATKTTTCNVAGLVNGDTYTFTVTGANMFGSSVASTPSNSIVTGPVVSGVSPSVGTAAGGDTVTITGQGFTGASAVTFGTNPATAFTVNSDSSITATSPAGTGLVDITVTAGGLTSPVGGGDQFTYVSSSATEYGYTCSATDSSASSTLVPIYVSDTTAPSTTAHFTAGTSFTTGVTEAAEFPSSVVDNWTGAGASSVTLLTAQTTLDGVDNSGHPSPAVTNVSSAATAVGVSTPSTYPIAPANGVTFSVTSAPVTFTFGPVTSSTPVNLVPGEIDFTLSYAGSGSAPVGVTCIAPTSPTALATITVTPPTPTPTYAVPASSVPLIGQVSPGAPAAWTTSVTNTSTTPVVISNITASVIATPPGGSPTAVSALVTLGNGGVTPVTLTRGASLAVTTYVPATATGALVSGTAISGTLTVTSSNVPGANNPIQASTLTPVTVVVIAGGVAAVATPGVTLTSSSLPLDQTLAAVGLKLPTKKIKTGSRHPGKAIVPPAVGVTLAAVPGNQVLPGFCGDGSCGQALQLTGNFGPYVNQKAPISATLKFFYGSSDPAGSVYWQGATSASPIKLPACVKSKTGYNTPCLLGPETSTGSTGAGTFTVLDTVLFVAGDPTAMRKA